MKNIKINPKCTETKANYVSGVEIDWEWRDGFQRKCENTAVSTG